VYLEKIIYLNELLNKCVDCGIDPCGVKRNVCYNWLLVEYYSSFPLLQQETNKSASSKHIKTINGNDMNQSSVKKPHYESFLLFPVRIILVTFQTVVTVMRRPTRLVVGSGTFLFQYETKRRRRRRFLLVGGVQPCIRFAADTSFEG